MSKTRRSCKCPICGETGIPTFFGLPVPRVMEAANKGLIALGGCEVYADEVMPSCWREEDQHGWDGPVPAMAILEALGMVTPAELSEVLPSSTF